MVFAIVLIRPGRTGETGAAPSVVTNDESGVASDAPQDSLPTTAPSDVTWELVGQTAVPVSKAAGPFQNSSTTAAGYAHTPVGALIAAAQLGMRGDFSSGRSTWEPTITQQFVPGRNRDRLLDRLRALSPEATEAPRSQIAGFLYQAYSADTAVIGMLYRSTDDPESTFVTTLTVQWRSGDWRMVAPPDGSWGALVHWAQIWTGAVEWKPPAAKKNALSGASGVGQGDGITVTLPVAYLSAANLSAVDLGSPSDYRRDPPAPGSGPTVYCKPGQDRTGPASTCAAADNDWLNTSDRAKYKKADDGCPDDKGFFGRGKCFLKDNKECWIEEDPYCDPIYGDQNKRQDDNCEDGGFWSVKGTCYLRDDGKTKCYEYGGLKDCATYYDGGESWIDKLILKDLKNSLKWAYKAIVTFWMELPPPNLSASNPDEDPVRWLRDRLDWLIGLAAVCALIFAGAKLALQRDGREAAAVVRGLVRLVVLNGGGAAAAWSLAKAGSLYSGWIMKEAIGNDPGKAIDTIFDRILGGDITGVSDIMPTFVVLGLGFLLLASGLMQIVLLVTRDAGLMLLVAMIPLASAFGLTSAGAAMPKRYVRMTLSILLVQPTIATVSAFGMVLLDARDGMTVFIGAVTLCLGVVAPFALPRLIAPVVGGGSVGNGDLDRGRSTLRKALGASGAAPVSSSGSARAGARRAVGAKAAAAAAPTGAGAALGAAKFALGVVRNSAAVAASVPAAAVKTAVGAGKVAQSAVVTAGKTASGAFENGPGW
jgi:hypothetical protein